MANGPKQTPEINIPRPVNEGPVPESTVSGRKFFINPKQEQPQTAEQASEEQAPGTPTFGEVIKGLKHEDGAEGAINDTGDMIDLAKILAEQENAPHVIASVVFLNAADRLRENVGTSKSRKQAAEYARNKLGKVADQLDSDKLRAFANPDEKTSRRLQSVMKSGNVAIDGAVKYAEKAQKRARKQAKKAKRL